MKNLLLVALLLFNFGIANGQSTLQGKITEATTNQPIAYVNIGIPAKGEGTVSNETGNFELEYSDPADLVTISSVGYMTQKKSVNELLQNGEVKLEQQIQEIKEIKVSANQFGAEQIFGMQNKESGRKVSMGFGHAKLGTEAGSVIRIKKETYLKSANFYQNSTDGGDLLFRVNIYRVEKGKIGEKVLQENVIVRAPQNRSVITVDLTPYELVVDHDVFLSLEWIKDEDGKGNQGITFLMRKGKKSNIWYKRTSQAPFKISTALGRFGLKKKSYCFWLVGKPVE